MTVDILLELALRWIIIMAVVVGAGYLGTWIYRRFFKSDNMHKK